MNNKKKKSMIYPTVFMIVLAAILTFLLALLNQQTKPLVAKNAELALKEKILYVFSVENDGSEADILAKFDQNIKDSGDLFNEEPVYVLEKDGNVQAYAISVKGPGLWGGIEGYLGLSSDHSEVLGIDFIQQEETPGLGGRIEEAFYKEQYRNVSVDKISTEVDFISGATNTSAAVDKLVNEDLKTYLESVGGTN